MTRDLTTVGQHSLSIQCSTPPTCPSSSASSHRPIQHLTSHSSLILAPPLSTFILLACRNTGVFAQRLLASQCRCKLDARMMGNDSVPATCTTSSGMIKSPECRRITDSWLQGNGFQIAKWSRSYWLCVGLSVLISPWCWDNLVALSEISTCCKRGVLGE